MRLSWLFTGQLTWGELGSYLSQLPMESAYRTALRDLFTDEELAEYAAGRDETETPHGPWSKQELLLASAIWELRQLVHVQLLRGQVKDLPTPEPIRVPGSISTKRKTRDPRAVAYLRQTIDQHASQEAG